MMQPSSSTSATIVSAENQNDATIVKDKFSFCHCYIVWVSNNAGDARGQSWNESLKSICIPGGSYGYTSGTKRKHFAAHSSPRPCWRWLQLQPSCGSPQWVPTHHKRITKRSIMIHIQNPHLRLVLPFRQNHAHTLLMKWTWRKNITRDIILSMLIVVDISCDCIKHQDCIAFFTMSHRIYCSRSFCHVSCVYEILSIWEFKNEMFKWRLLYW